MSTEDATRYADDLTESIRTYDGDPYAWADDILDVRRTYGNDGQLLSVSLLVAFGGPNAWVEFDGRGAEVRVTWYCEAVVRYAPCVELSEAMLELFHSWQVTR